MSGSSPYVSVVVPVYEDPAGVRETLACLAEQHYPSDRHEIVVVDNGSADETPAVVAEFADRFEPITLAFERTIQGSYAARNEGIAQSTGDLLLFVDADVTVPDTWIADVVEQFQNSDVDYLGCGVEQYVPEDAPGRLGAYDLALAFPVELYLRERQYAPTCALAVRRDVIDAVGPFRSDLVSGGDREFGERVAAAGFEQAVATDVVVRHPARTTAAALGDKYVRVGRGQQQLAQRYDETATTRPLWHPFVVLPPDPRTFSERLSTDPGPARWLAYYLLAYVTKLCRLYGRVLERVRTSESDVASTDDSIEEPSTAGADRPSDPSD